MAVEVELGVSIDKALQIIRDTSWDRITIIGYIGEDAKVLSSERTKDQVVTRVKRAFPELDTESSTIV